MICFQASSFGCGNSIFRSIRPDLMSAGSRMSGRLVAAMTLISDTELKRRVSWAVRAWSARLPDPPISQSRIDCLPRRRSRLFVWQRSPEVWGCFMVFIWSRSLPMKKMVGALSAARAKTSRTILAPSPIYIWTGCEPASFKKVALVWDAQPRANMVFLVPGTRASRPLRHLDRSLFGNPPFLPDQPPPAKLLRNQNCGVPAQQFGVLLLQTRSKGDDP